MSSQPRRVRGLPPTGRDARADGVIELPADARSGDAVGGSPAAGDSGSGAGSGNGSAGSGGVTAGPAGVVDPLRLCVYATIALLAWVFGPLALLAFAVIGLLGYWRAWRAGLTRSKCVLRDTRLVLAYLGLLAAAALVGIGQKALSWLT